MPCFVQQDDPGGARVAAYQTSRTPASLLDMGPSGGCSFRAERARDGKAYKRYAACRRQRNWSLIRTLLQTLQQDATNRLAREQAAQRAYDARVLRDAVPQLLQKLRDFRGAGNRRLFDQIAARIAALDDQGKIALAPWLARNHCVRAKSIRAGISGHPALNEAYNHLRLVVDGLHDHAAQIDFCSPSQCTRLGIRSEDERVDIVTQEPFVPSQTLLVTFDEGGDRNMCLPWSCLATPAAANVVDHTGTWQRQGRGEGREYVDGRNRGDPVCATHRLFPSNNNRLYAQPIVVPTLRLARLRRPAVQV